MDKIKIALLLCGQARYYEKGFEHIKKSIIDIYNPDIYIHTWKYKDNITYSAPWNNLGPLTISNDDIYKYIKLYDPKDYQVENELEQNQINLKKDKYERTSHENTRYNYYSYLYSLYKCFNLAKNSGIKYDLYIIVRSDLYIYSFPKSLDLINITIWNRLYNRTDGVLDNMVCSVPNKFIETFVDLVNRLDEYYDKGYYFNYEEMTHAHFKETKLYNNTILVTRDILEWGYYRGTNIQRM